MVICSLARRASRPYVWRQFGTHYLKMDWSHAEGDTTRADFFIIAFDERMSVDPLNGRFEAQLLTQFRCLRLQFVAFFLKVSNFIYPLAKLLIEGSVTPLIHQFEKLKTITK
jgi:hypothetical protein